jgi:hypothetical protein
VNVLISVRDFALLDGVGGLLTGRDEINVHSVSWSVDDDNPDWALVRAHAIQAALLKGQDYASALAGSVVRVEHVADAGLLGGATVVVGDRERTQQIHHADRSGGHNPDPRIGLDGGVGNRHRRLAADT